MNNNDLQTLIDLPSGYVVEFNPWNKVGDAFVESSNVETTTDFLIAIATELLERRAFDEWNPTEHGRQMYFERYSGLVWLIDDSTSVASGSTPFEAWQNAKEAGKL